MIEMGELPRAGRIENRIIAFSISRKIMLLTISTTHKPATDLGFILLKNPENLHSFELSFGKAHVFFPEASEERCTACLLLDVDSVNLVRAKGSNQGIEQYVNDRPYVASSFMSVAIAQVFGTALSGKSKQRQELAEMNLPLTAHLSAIPCGRNGEALLKSLFEPLRYEIKAERLALDESFPEWGQSNYYALEIKGQQRLQDLLKHLYVLIPVLDDEKHYFVGSEEVEKLLRHGGDWLASHPEKNLISNRYLAHKKSLSRLALMQLSEAEQELCEIQSEQNIQEAEIEKPLSLKKQRIQAVLEELKTHGARRIIDLGCGEGDYIRELLENREFDLIAGSDVSCRVLEKAAQRLRLERMNEREQKRLSLFQASLLYKDERFSGFDAAICIEVIEHMDLFRIPYLERSLFKYARPKLVIITTPNFEYNKKFESLPAGKFRHGDHRFEWTRDEFRFWAGNTAVKHGYKVEFKGVGPLDPELGAPTQMAVFSIKEEAPV